MPVWSQDVACSELCLSASENKRRAERGSGNDEGDAGSTVAASILRSRMPLATAESNCRVNEEVMSVIFTARMQSSKSNTLAPDTRHYDLSCSNCRSILSKTNLIVKVIIAAGTAPSIIK